MEDVGSQCKQGLGRNGRMFGYCFFFFFSLFSFTLLISQFSSVSVSFPYSLFSISLFQSFHLFIYLTIYPSHSTELPTYLLIYSINVPYCQLYISYLFAHQSIYLSTYLIYINPFVLHLSFCSHRYSHTLGEERGWGGSSCLVHGVWGRHDDIQDLHTFVKPVYQKQSQRRVHLLTKKLNMLGNIYIKPE